MKRIATQKNGFWKRVFINIPFVLLIALMIALFGGGLLLIFYSIASLFAFKSAMIFLILAGAGVIAIGAGLALIVAYRKYFDFYNKKMGWEYPDKPKKEQKSVVDGKNPSRTTSPCPTSRSPSLQSARFLQSYRRLSGASTEIIGLPTQSLLWKATATIPT